MQMMSEQDWIAQKNAFLQQHSDNLSGFPLFSILEFNLLAACTRKCSFCPVSQAGFYAKQYKNVFPRTMTQALFEKVIQDLQQVQYKGELAFSGFSEPLLHPKLDVFIRIARTQLPDATLKIITNGDLLTRENLMAYFESGLDELTISVYDGEHQLNEFKTFIKSLGRLPGAILLRKRYFNGKDFGFTMTNRGGMLKDNQTVQSEKRPYLKACYYPFHFLKIDLNGDVLFCPHNWRKMGIVGNVLHEPIDQIWNGEKLEAIRKSLCTGRRNLPSCRECDAMGTKTGNQLFELWKHTKHI